MGIFISACYLGFGISSLRTNAGWWLTYYIDVATMQFLLYRFMRRHNVSPHEPAGSSGLSGMLVSALTAPIYARSLIKVLLRRKLSFNVTAKGSTSRQDRLWTFRYSLMWALVPIVVLPLALLRHRPFPMMIAWTAVILAVCLAPIGIWLSDRALGAAWERSGRARAERERRARERAAREHAALRDRSARDRSARQRPVREGPAREHAALREHAARRERPGRDWSARDRSARDRSPLEAIGRRPAEPPYSQPTRKERVER
jgi:hypothetical protein